MQSFELVFTVFHDMESKGVPSDRVRDGDGLDFDGGQLIQTVGECIIVVGYKF